MSSHPKSATKCIEVLVVEDSPTQVAHLKYLLEEQGYMVTAATNGRQALACVRKRKPTIIISDIMMPEMDGYTLCQTIKSDRELLDIPVILVTDLNSPQDVVMGLQCCADNFITKPYDHQFLLARITQSLRNRELRANTDPRKPVEIDLVDHRYVITAERHQILDLLIPTYEEAVRLNQKLREQQQDLAAEVQERTAANKQLLAEMAERKRAEDERDRFFTLSLDLLCIAGFDGYFKRLNPSWERVLGYTTEELLAEPYLTFIHPDDRNATIVEAHKNAAGGHTTTFENRYRCKDGSYRWLLWSAMPAPEPQLIYAIARDITERKQAEEALREGEQRFRTLANNISQLAWMADEQGRIFWYNQRWFDYSGTTLKDMEGWGWQKIHHPDYVREVVQKIQHCFQTGEVWEDTFPLRGRDGNYRWFLSRAVPILNEQGQVLRWFGTHTDITERLETEMELTRRREQLEAVNKELESFSYSVSHDLRAPLRHIDGFADLLRKHAASMLDEKGHRYLLTISDSAKQMGRLIDDLLAFSRAGRAELRHTDVSLNDLVTEVLQEFKTDLDARPIVWSIDPLPNVHGDRAMLRQVFSNLIGNAIKYTGTRDLPKIEIGKCENGSTETVVFIRDNGVGFDMKYVHKLFGVFQRLHRSEDFEGTGIGLANVKRIISKHGGRVWGEGDVGRGATFYVAMPREMEGARHDE